MEATRTSETLVSIHNTTRRQNRQKLHLKLHRRENLKSGSKMVVSYFKYWLNICQEGHNETRKSDQRVMISNTFPVR
jgi:hypothetical protein